MATNLDGFSLANRRQFAKFAKLFTCQTFSLYGKFNVKLIKLMRKCEIFYIKTVSIHTYMVWLLMPVTKLDKV